MCLCYAFIFLYVFVAPHPGVILAGLALLAIEVLKSSHTKLVGQAALERNLYVGAIGAFGVGIALQVQTLLSWQPTAIHFVIIPLVLTFLWVYGYEAIDSRRLVVSSCSSC